MSRQVGGRSDCPIRDAGQNQASPKPQRAEIGRSTAVGIAQYTTSGRGEKIQQTSKRLIFFESIKALRDKEEIKTTAGHCAQEDAAESRSRGRKKITSSRPGNTPLKGSGIVCGGRAATVTSIGSLAASFRQRESGVFRQLRPGILSAGGGGGQLIRGKRGKKKPHARGGKEDVFLQLDRTTR